MVRLEFDRGTLLLHSEAGADDRSAVPGVELPDFLFDPRAGAWRAPADRYRQTVAALHRAAVEHQDDARAYEELEVRLNLLREPFPHQAEAVEDWWRSGRRGVVVLPTGAGKTYVAQLLIERLARSALVVTPTLDLMQQWYGALATGFDTEVGLIGGGYYDVQPLTVTTYDSAYLHMERLGNRFGLLVFDECHHLPGPSYAFAAEASIAPFRLGLTATPEREDGGELRYPELIGPIVYRREIGDLAGRYLADYDTERLTVRLSPSEREEYQAERALYRDFVARHNIRLGSGGGWGRFLMLTSRSEDGRRALLAFRRQKEIAQGSQAKLRLLGRLLERHRHDRVLIFTSDNDTVYRISRRFLVPAITHQTRVKERHATLQRFNRGDYPFVVTSKVLNEGVDVPAANVGVVLSGTGSVREHVQRLGRILRRAEGKRALLYEVVAADTAEGGDQRAPPAPQRLVGPRRPPRLSPPMLPTDLVEARIRKGCVVPRWIDADDPPRTALAASLIDALENGPRTDPGRGPWRARGARRRGHRVSLPPRPDQAAVRSLHLRDGGAARSRGGSVRRCSPPQPRVGPETSRALTTRRPMIRRDDGRTVRFRFDREAVLAAAAEALGDPAGGAELEPSLYADLKSQQALTGFAPCQPRWLLDRYNVALAQAVLLRASELTVHLRNQSPRRYRALFRKIKFFRLLHRIERAPDGDGYSIHLDGPLSLFRSSQRYGPADGVVPSHPAPLRTVAIASAGALGASPPGAQVRAFFGQGAAAPDRQADRPMAARGDRGVGRAPRGAGRGRVADPTRCRADRPRRRGRAGARTSLSSTEPAAARRFSRCWATGTAARSRRVSTCSGAAAHRAWWSPFRRRWRRERTASTRSPRRCTSTRRRRRHRGCSRRSSRRPASPPADRRSRGCRRRCSSPPPPRR